MSPIAPGPSRVRTFGYPGADRPLLGDMRFVAEPGKTTAIVRSTGAGKTSLLILD
ncbi:MAG: hypothetical protein H7226_07175 [Salinibacterium sp.]|nr:hypothetical protein [Salinibacterium sp.]